MKRLMELLRDNKTGPRIVVAGIGLLVVVIPTIIFAINNSINAPRYEQGDFSDFPCEVYGCDNSSTWRLTSYAHMSTYYYCAEHESEGRKLYNRYTNSNSSQDTVKCQSCGRSFQKGSKNAKNITNTNMCLDCYRSFKSMQDAIKEQPVS